MTLCLAPGNNEEPLSTPLELMEEGSHSVPASCAQPPLPSASSSESLYESCVSEVEPNSPIHNVQSTPPVAEVTTPSLSPCSTRVLELSSCQRDQSATVTKKTSGSKIPRSSVKSPVPSQLKDVSTPMLEPSASPLTLSAVPSSSTYLKKSQHKDSRHQRGGCTTVKKLGNKERVLASTHVKSTPPLMDRGSPIGPLNGTYTLSPMNVPYLREGYTPKTVMKLQEEYRARTKGKLVSLADLRSVCIDVVTLHTQSTLSTNKHNLKKIISFQPSR